MGEEDVEPVLNSYFTQGSKQKDLKVVFICKKGTKKWQCTQSPEAVPNYSRTSMARTLMAHLPRLFRTRS